MRRRLVLVGLVGALSLVGAGAAAADVTYTNGTWFIGRSDVTANLGKGALLPSATAEWYMTATYTSTCTYADGATKLLQVSQPTTIDYKPEPRYAWRSA